MNSPRTRLSPFSAFILHPSSFILLLFLLTACPSSPPPPASPTPTPPPTPAATASPSPTPEIKAAAYSGKEQMAYISTAQQEFVALRAEKSTSYLESHAALEAAGSVNAAGLTSKDAIAARRALVAKCSAGNDQYLDFVKAQVDAYRAELAKTPLLPADAASLADQFAAKANTDAIVKLRETERDALKAGDDMLAYLDKTYGDWSVTGGKLAFKKKSAVSGYAALAEKYNKLATDEQKMIAAINNPNPVPSVAAPSPASSPTP